MPQKSSLLRRIRKWRDDEPVTSITADFSSIPIQERVASMEKEFGKGVALDVFVAQWEEASQAASSKLSSMHQQSQQQHKQPSQQHGNVLKERPVLWHHQDDEDQDEEEKEEAHDHERCDVDTMIPPTASSATIRTSLCVRSAYEDKQRQHYYDCHDESKQADELPPPPNNNNLYGRYDLEDDSLTVTPQCPVLKIVDVQTCTSDVCLACRASRSPTVFLRAPQIKARDIRTLPDKWWLQHLSDNDNQNNNSHAHRHKSGKAPSRPEWYKAIVDRVSQVVKNSSGSDPLVCAPMTTNTTTTRSHNNNNNNNNNNTPKQLQDPACRVPSLVCTPAAATTTPTDSACHGVPSLVCTPSKGRLQDPACRGVPSLVCAEHATTPNLPGCAPRVPTWTRPSMLNDPIICTPIRMDDLPRTLRSGRAGRPRRSNNNNKAVPPPPPNNIKNWRLPSWDKPIQLPQYYCGVTEEEKLDIGLTI